MADVLRVILLVALAAAALTTGALVLNWWMEPIRRMRRALLKSLGAVPEAEALSPAEGRAAGLDFVEGIDQAVRASIPQDGDLAALEIQSGGPPFLRRDRFGLGDGAQGFQHGATEPALGLHPPVQRQGGRRQGGGGESHQQDDAQSLIHFGPDPSQSASSITTGTWSEGFSMSRASRCVSTPTNRSAAWGDNRWKSMRMP